MQASDKVLSQAEIDAMSARLADGLVRGEREHREIAMETRRMNRVLCLTEVPDSPTMWAHYADDHRGAVLEFEPGCDKKLKDAKQVQYSKTMIPFADPRFMAQYLMGMRSEAELDDHFEDPRSSAIYGRHGGRPLLFQQGAIQVQQRFDRTRVCLRLRRSAASPVCPIPTQPGWTVIRRGPPPESPRCCRG